MRLTDSNSLVANELVRGRLPPAMQQAVAAPVDLISVGAVEAPGNARFYLPAFLFATVPVLASGCRARMARSSATTSGCSAARFRDSAGSAL